MWKKLGLGYGLVSCANIWWNFVDIFIFSDFAGLSPVIGLPRPGVVPITGGLSWTDFGGFWSNSWPVDFWFSGFLVTKNRIVSARRLSVWS